MCARLIIASGVAKVIYIEPYPKSLTSDLYEKSVVVEAEKTDIADDYRVAFSCFIGVSPNRFAELFSYRRGKDSEGYAVDWKPDQTLVPRFFEPPKTIPDHEAVIVAALAHLDQTPAINRPAAEVARITKIRTRSAKVTRQTNQTR
jgi:cytidine deaminase